MGARRLGVEAIPYIHCLARRVQGLIIPEVSEHLDVSYSTARRFVHYLVERNWIRWDGGKRRRTDAFGSKAGRGGDVLRATRRRLPVGGWERARRRRKLQARRTPS